VLQLLEEELRARLALPLPGADVQRRFAPRPPRRRWDPAARPADARAAAALLLLYPGPAGLSVALTLRPTDLPHHGGQISLPGGGLHDGETAEQGALREAQEEIGINPEDIRVIGPLSSLWVIVSRFIVQPIVAVADTRPDFAPSPREVETLIEAPLSVLRDPAAMSWDRRVIQGADIWVPYFDVDGHHVWGATAMMIGELIALQDPAFGPGPLPTT
jgi:8-oxo-dGTP pyrophosphatase MutT (NUDIX family)